MLYVWVIVVIIILLLVYLIGYDVCKRIIGGGTFIKPQKSNPVIVDGMNFMYHLKQLTHRNTPLQECYYNLIDKSSQLLIKAFPKQDIYFVFKNLDTIDKDKLSKISAKYRIKYYLAHDNIQKSEDIGHHIHGRDDLTVQILNNQIPHSRVISLDKYSDHGLFGEVPSYILHSIVGGTWTARKINPSKLPSMNPVTSLSYKIIDRRDEN